MTPHIFTAHNPLTGKPELYKASNAKQVERYLTRELLKSLQIGRLGAVEVSDRMSAGEKVTNLLGTGDGDDAGADPGSNASSPSASPSASHDGDHDSAGHDTPGGAATLVDARPSSSEGV